MHVALRISPYDCTLSNKSSQNLSKSLLKNSFMTLEHIGDIAEKFSSWGFKIFFTEVGDKLKFTQSTNKFISKFRLKL